MREILISGRLGPTNMSADVTEETPNKMREQSNNFRWCLCSRHGINDRTSKIKAGAIPIPSYSSIGSKNIRLSISSYQVTTFVDLGPYFEYFESYERYLNNFIVDLSDRSRMSHLAKYHHDAVVRTLTTYSLFCN